MSSLGGSVTAGDGGGLLRRGREDKKHLPFIIISLQSQNFFDLHYGDFFLAGEIGIKIKNPDTRNRDDGFESFLNI
jgi:hypothetical protein